MHLKFWMIFTYLSSRICYSHKQVKINYMDDVLETSINHVHLHQVVLFLSRDNRSHPAIADEIDDIVKFVSTRRSTILVETSSQQVENWNKRTNELHDLFKNPRHSTLFISIFHQSKDPTVNLASQLNKNIQFIINLSRRRTRPHLLFIILDHRISKDEIRYLLFYAWTKKFLDLTVVQKLEDRRHCAIDLMLHYFNPFGESYHHHCYLPSLKIFPNKLKDMKSSPIKVALIPRPPNVNFGKDSYGKPMRMNGTEYATIAMLSHKLNFTVDWVTPDVRSYSEPIDKYGKTVLDMIVRGEFEFGANQVYLHLALKDKLRQGERSVPTYVDEYCALVPVFHVPTWVIGHEVLMIMVNAVGHVVVAYFLVKVFRFDMRYWQPHHTFQIILGNTAPRLPTRSVERIFFVVITVLSIRYAGYLYAKLTDINLLQLDLGPFFNYEDLARSDLTLEMHPFHKNMTFHDPEEPLLRELANKVRLIDDVMDCPFRLLEDRNVACLMDHTVAEAFLINESRLHHRPRMKIMKPCFWSAPKGCIFSEASPYVNAFNDVIQQIYETGLWMKWSLWSTSKRKAAADRWKPSGRDDFGNQDGFLSKKLVILWSVGCTVACVAFLSEFIVKYTSR